MTIHWLYSGGENHQNAGYGFFPSAVPTVAQVMPPAAHRAPVYFGIEQILDFGATQGSLYQYITQNTTGALLDTNGAADQDVFLVAIPIGHSIVRAYLSVVTAGTTGATADLRQVLVATPPTEPTLVGAALATGVAMDAVANFRYTPATQFNGTALQGLVLRFPTIPTGGLGNLRVRVSAIIERPFTGQGY